MGSAKQMTRDEIVDQIITLLRSHEKHGGYFHQEPYKGDFFRLFVLANECGAGLKADRLRSLIASRAPELFDGKNWPLLYAAGRSGTMPGRAPSPALVWTMICPAANWPLPDSRTTAGE